MRAERFERYGSALDMLNATTPPSLAHKVPCPRVPAPFLACDSCIASSSVAFTFFLLWLADWMVFLVRALSHVLGLAEGPFKGAASLDLAFKEAAKKPAKKELAAEFSKIEAARLARAASKEAAKAAAGKAAAAQAAKKAKAKAWLQAQKQREREAKARSKAREAAKKAYGAARLASNALPAFHVSHPTICNPYSPFRLQRAFLPHPVRGVTACSR